MVKTSYLVALGSNRRHGTHGAPADTLAAGLRAIAAAGIRVDAVSAVRATPALGPAGRGFANAAALVSTDLSPPALLAELKRIERAFGRRSGRRWGPRVLDLDLILWSDGCWDDGALTVPHPEFRRRRFVLEPLADVAPMWRDPLTGRSIRHLLHLDRRRRPMVDRAAGRT